MTSFTTDSGLQAEAVKIAERYLAEPTVKLNAILRDVHCLDLKAHAIAILGMRARAQKVVDGGGNRGLIDAGGRGCLIRWSPRPNFRRFGAFYPKGKRTCDGPLIEVSSMLKADGCHEKAKSTLAHEIGHWIAAAAGQVGRGHGPIWKEVATMCGGAEAASRLVSKSDPRVEAEVDRLRKKRNGEAHVYACERCGKSVEFTPRQHKASSKYWIDTGGDLYHHVKCKGGFQFKGGV